MSQASTRCPAASELESSLQLNDPPGQTAIGPPEERNIFDHRALTEKSERREIQHVEGVVQVHPKIQVTHLAPESRTFPNAQICAEVPRAAKRIPPDAGWTR